MSGGDDLFSATLNLEESALQAGRAEGAAAGRAEGEAEGYAMGLEQGHKLASELGFYRGCCLAWLALRREPNSRAALKPELTGASEKAVAAMEALAEMAAAVPRESTQDQDLVLAVQKCRAKFKAITSLLHADVKFDPQADVAARDMTF